MITSTGEIFPVAHIRRLRKLLPGTAIVPMYGLTECKRVSIAPPDEPGAPVRSVGRPLPGTHVEVVDERGEPLPPGRIGELTVSGPHLATGYWNRPEETARRFRIDRKTEERRLYTGDLFSRDDQGWLYFHGRDGTFVKINGRRIGTTELEASILSLGSVVEAAVLGVPDPVRGEQLVVYATLSSASRASEGTIRRALRRLIPVSLNRPIVIVGKRRLPRTKNGKIDRRQLQRLATEVAADAVSRFP
jgi:acyl-coenzyme A synthetase/AMP-(fatty) acid ligase